jgi:hypothetical protein
VLKPAITGPFDRARWLLAGVGVRLALLLGLCITATAAQAAGESVNSYACGGRVEAKVWRQWDKTSFPYAQGQLIQERLVGAGDSYALYDLEIVFHNLLAMAQRCQRSERQLQLLKLVTVAYAQLAPAPDNQTGRAWVCRGGAVCNGTNRLVNTEVMLNSAQFLAFAASLAQGVNQGGKSALSDNFVEQTARVALEHMTRWSALQTRISLRKRIAARPEDVRDGSSTLFLTDRELWQMAIYADLAGVLATQPQLAKLAGLDDAAFAVLQEHLVLLLRLFSVRTTTEAVFDRQHNKTLKLADLDAGFWRLYADSRYAGYTGNDKPVVCNKKADNSNTFEVATRIDPSGIAPVRTLGWDLSHSRRLVHFFEAIERNRGHMVKVFGLASEDLPSREIMAAFARQLRMRVWNQDESKPLFANYFNGANGWYRVAYDNGTGRCQAGYPPYGLTDAFPTGGFATWAELDPGLRGLGERLYDLTHSSHLDDLAFVSTYYSTLGAKASANVRMVAEIMFWPTLVGH